MLSSTNAFNIDNNKSIIRKISESSDTNYSLSDFLLTLNSCTVLYF